MKRNLPAAKAFEPSYFHDVWEEAEKCSPNLCKIHEFRDAVILRTQLMSIEEKMLSKYPSEYTAFMNVLGFCLACGCTEAYSDTNATVEDIDQSEEEDSCTQALN